MDAAKAIEITADECTDLRVTEGSKHPGRPGMVVHYGGKTLWVPLPPKQLIEEPIVGPAPELTEEEMAAERLEWLESLRAAREELMK
jgi:hypothetical protein